MLRIDVEGVVHGARRMVVRDVQRGEVVEIMLDLGAGRDGEAQRVEQLFDTLQRQRDRMQAANIGATTGQGDIQRFGSELERQLALLQGVTACLQGRFYLLFDDIDTRAGGGTLLIGEFAQAF